MMVSGSGVRQVPGLLLCGFGGFRRAVLEAEAVVSGFEDVAVVSEAVEQRRRHLGVAEDSGPFAEAEVCGDDDAGAFVKLAQEVEQQRAAGSAERQVAEFVEDDEIGIGEASGDLPGFSLVFFLFEGVDEFDGREEPDTFAMMFDRLDADGGGQMRLARSGSADQDGVVSVFQELAAIKLADKSLVDLARGEVKAGEIAIVRKAGGLELVGRRSHLPVGGLRLQELRQDRQRGLEGRRALFGQLADRAWAIPCILRLRSMTTMAPAAGL